MEKTFEIDVFANVDQFRVRNTGRVVQKGVHFGLTAELSLRELILFFERDLFQASKRGEIPSVTVDFQINENQKDSHINVRVGKIQKTGLRASRTFFANKIAQILWAYNYNSYLPEIDGYERRFTYTIDFDDTFECHREGSGLYWESPFEQATA